MKYETLSAGDVSVCNRQKNDNETANREFILPVALFNPVLYNMLKIPRCAETACSNRCALIIENKLPIFYLQLDAEIRVFLFR